MQFESLSMVLLVSGTSLAIATVVGTFVTTWMTGKNRKNECSGSLYRIAVLGLAVGYLGACC